MKNFKQILISFIFVLAFAANSQLEAMLQCPQPELDETNDVVETPYLERLIYEAIKQLDPSNPTVKYFRNLLTYQTIPSDKKLQRRREVQQKHFRNLALMLQRLFPRHINMTLSSLQVFAYTIIEGNYYEEEDIPDYIDRAAFAGGVTNLFR